MAEITPREKFIVEQHDLPLKIAAMGKQYPGEEARLQEWFELLDVCQVSDYEIPRFTARAKIAEVSLEHVTADKKAAMKERQTYNAKKAADMTTSRASAVARIAAIEKELKENKQAREAKSSE